MLCFDCCSVYLQKSNVLNIVYMDEKTIVKIKLRECLAYENQILRLYPIDKADAMALFVLSKSYLSERLLCTSIFGI